MIKLSQENRQARIDTPLGDDVLMLQSFSGTEAISQCYEYSAQVVSEDHAVDGNQIVGKPVSVTYFCEEGTERVFHGIVSRIEYGEQVEEPAKLTSYTLSIVPWLWLLNHNTDCQIFQSMTAPDVIKKVFTDLGFTDFRMSLTGNYPEREYCVQYRESNLNFVSRLMEEEGIFYFFEHSKDKHTLVMCDATSGYVDLGDDVVYSPIGQEHFAQLTSWKHVYEFRPGKVEHKDFNFKKPTDPLKVGTSSKIKFDGSSSLQVFEYPGLFDESGKGDRLAKVRMEELEAEHDRVEGAGYYVKFTPGGKFKIEKHSRESEVGKSYTLVQVYTEFNSNLGFGHEGSVDFRNEFRCIPAETVYRPRRSTMKPVVEGPQTAIIVTDGQEIVVDEHARVKVQFHWDRYGKMDINSSCWIRVSQVHAGKGWGMIDIPRKDEEVIVSFLDGDPDRPIITGRVYNQDNPPPFGLKGAGNNLKNKTRRGNKTKSYEAQGYNEMTMDDTEGKEEIRIHGQKDLNAVVQNNETRHVVKGTQDVKVKGKTSLTVEEGDRTVNVLKATYNLTAHKSVKLLGSTEGVAIEGKTKGVSVTGSGKGVTITGTPNFDASGKSTATITSPDVKIGDKNILVSGTDVKIKGTTVTISAGGGSIKIDSAGITISGTMIKSAASGINEVSGSLVKIN